MRTTNGRQERASRFQRLGLRVFPCFADEQKTVQRLVGTVGGIGTSIVGVVNWFIYSYVNDVGVVESFNSSYTGLILLFGLILLGCGFWDHPIARWAHIGLFAFSGVFGAVSANLGDITSAFFVVFAIILLVEYRFKRKIAWVLALLLLAGYVTALAIGYQDDAPRPVMSAFTSLISVLTFVGLFGGVILRHRIQLQRNAAGLEDRIAERTVDLNKALSERTVMLQEIHHRVKNNMQTISTLLGMEVDKMPDAAAKGALTASQQRIQAMASVHDVLYRSEHLDRVDLSDYTRDLVDTLLQTALCPIELDLQVSEAGAVSISFAGCLGMVLNELVSNALKHGFDPRTGGKLRVALTSDGQCIVLEVEDNGKGLPDGFVPEEQSGVGMSVVTSIVRHRGGKIDFRSNGGTCWRLELPLSVETE